MASRPHSVPLSLPRRPVSPESFIEDVIPSLFVDLELSPAEREAELRLGIVLLGDTDGEGDTGGEWTLHFVAGELGIARGRDPACDVTLLQRVADWRASLWEGRPAFIADLLRAPGDERSPTRPALPFGVVGPGVDRAVVEEMRSLRGRVDLSVESATAVPWQLALQLGPGPLRENADARIALDAAQAEAIHRGELHPLEALMTGTLRLEGDLALILQLQALALRSTLAR